MSEFPRCLANSSFHNHSFKKQPFLFFSKCWQFRTRHIRNVFSPTCYHRNDSYPKNINIYAFTTCAEVQDSRRKCQEWFSTIIFNLDLCIHFFSREISTLEKWKESRYATRKWKYMYSLIINRWQPKTLGLVRHKDKIVEHLFSVDRPHKWINHRV